MQQKKNRSLVDISLNLKKKLLFFFLNETEIDKVN
jgi:hypothetical protein